MLAIRMQRTGRKGHAMFRVVVQESRYTPTSGRVVANLGHYDPHTKNVVIDKEKASTFLSNGAQPSERVARLLKKEGVKLPDWVILSENKTRKARNPEKLRSQQPKVEKAAEEPVVTAEDAPASTSDDPVAEASEEKSAEDSAEKTEA